MEDATVIKIVAVVAITVLEAAAILTGLDGAYFGIVVAAVGGIAGYELRGLSLKKQEAKDEA